MPEITVLVVLWFSDRLTRTLSLYLLIHDLSRLLIRDPFAPSISFRRNNISLAGMVCGCKWICSLFSEATLISSLIFSHKSVVPYLWIVELMRIIAANDNKFSPSNNESGQQFMFAWRTDPPQSSMSHPGSGALKLQASGTSTRSRRGGLLKLL